MQPLMPGQQPEYEPQAAQVTSAAQIRPAPGWILIQEEDAEGVTEGGLIIPSTTEHHIYRVMAAGVDAAGLEPGQLVLLSALIRDLGAATKIMVGSKGMALILAEYVAAVVSE